MFVEIVYAATIDIMRRKETKKNKGVAALYMIMNGYSNHNFLSQLDLVVFYAIGMWRMPRKARHIRSVAVQGSRFSKRAPDLIQE